MIVDAYLTTRADPLSKQTLNDLILQYELNQ